jgi:hypothetical protein
MRGFISHLETSSDRRRIAYLAGIFACVHAAYYLAGVRFDASSLNFSMQYLDRELLTTKLLQSLYYLHIQPPLFNLFLGSVLKLVPGHPEVLFQVIYVCAGFVLYSSIFLLQVRLGVSALVALILSTAFVASPSFITYEHMLFYTFPAAVLLAFSALLLSSFLRDARFVKGLAFFSLLMLIPGIRSMFHIVWFCVIAAALVVYRRRNRRIVALAALGPFLILFSFFFKNYVLFDRFTTSTWNGMNLWYTSGLYMPLAERERLVGEDKLSEAALIPLYQDSRDYPISSSVKNKYPHVEALTQIRKSTGTLNFNNFAYIAISDQYFLDTVYLARHYPKYIFVGISKALFDYFKSTTEHGYLAFNLRKLSRVDSVYNRLVFGKVSLSRAQGRRIPGFPQGKDYVNMYPLLALGLFATLLYAILFTLGMAGPRAPTSGAQRGLLLFMIFNIIYVACVATLASTGENNRYRFCTDPLYLVLFGVLLQHFILRRLRSLSPFGRS